jgi:DNA polymerase III alpha subunit
MTTSLFRTLTLFLPPTLYDSRLKRIDALDKAAAASCNLDRFAAQLAAAKQRFEANKAQKKLVVLRDHQNKTFARWAKRTARQAKEEAVQATIKAMQLRIAALEEEVRALRAREVQAASEEKKGEKEVEETPREER